MHTSEGDVGWERYECQGKNPSTSVLDNAVGHNDFALSNKLLIQELKQYALNSSLQIYIMLSS